MLVYICIVVLTVADTRRCPRVDVVELNHIHRSERVEPFVQVILWRWNRTTYEVAEWMASPERFRVEKGVITWEKFGVPYRVRYVSYRESHTKYDPEVENRKILREEQRVPYFPGKEITLCPSD